MGQKHSIEIPLHLTKKLSKEQLHQFVKWETRLGPPFEVNPEDPEGTQITYHNSVHDNFPYTTAYPFISLIGGAGSGKTCFFSQLQISAGGILDQVYSLCTEYGPIHENMVFFSRQLFRVCASSDAENARAYFNNIDISSDLTTSFSVEEIPSIIKHCYSLYNDPQFREVYQYRTYFIPHSVLQCNLEYYFEKSDFFNRFLNCWELLQENQRSLLLTHGNDGITSNMTNQSIQYKRQMIAQLQATSILTTQQRAEKQRIKLEKAANKNNNKNDQQQQEKIASTPSMTPESRNSFYNHLDVSQAYINQQKAVASPGLLPSLGELQSTSGNTSNTTNGSNNNNGLYAIATIAESPNNNNINNNNNNNNNTENSVSSTIAPLLTTPQVSPKDHNSKSNFESYSSLSNHNNNNNQQNQQNFTSPDISRVQHSTSNLTRTPSTFHGLAKSQSNALHRSKSKMQSSLSNLPQVDSSWNESNQVHWADRVHSNINTTQYTEKLITLQKRRFFCSDFGGNIAQRKLWRDFFFKKFDIACFFIALGDFDVRTTINLQQTSHLLLQQQQHEQFQSTLNSISGMKDAANAAAHHRANNLSLTSSLSNTNSNNLVATPNNRSTTSSINEEENGDKFNPNAPLPNIKNHERQGSLLFPPKRSSTFMFDPRGSVLYTFPQFANAQIPKPTGPITAQQILANENSNALVEQINVIRNDVLLSASDSFTKPVKPYLNIAKEGSKQQQVAVPCQQPILLIFTKVDVYFDKIRKEQKMFEDYFPNFAGNQESLDDVTGYLQRLLFKDSTINPDTHQIETVTVNLTNREDVAIVTNKLLKMIDEHITKQEEIYAQVGGGSNNDKKNEKENNNKNKKDNKSPEQTTTSDRISSINEPLASPSLQISPQTSPSPQPPPFNGNNNNNTVVPPPTPVIVNTTTLPSTEPEAV